MNKLFNFLKRNLKEVFRDPIIYVFCLGFPLIMFVLFQIIDRYTNGHTPMFELRSLLPSIVMFSYSFVMLTMALLVSKDRQTFLLKRLYSSPMKSYEFVLGYSWVGLIIGFSQTLICILTGYIISLITGVGFISFSQTLLLVISQMPILLVNIFLGVLFGTIFNDKSAPGICSIFISLAGVLGGCWMPVETMGKFEVFCRCLPFYPSVYIGRVTTGATSALNITYTFDKVACLGFVPISLFMILSILLSFIFFKIQMTNDK